MLNKLLNLVPPVVVRYIGNKSFANLQNRGEIKTWMVGYTQNSSLLLNRDEADDDGDDDDFNLGDFDFDDFDLDAAPRTCGIQDDYIDRQISKISQYGDGARWRLADYLDMFGEDLDRSGTLTDEQREDVDNFVGAYQSKIQRMVTHE
jgi:hypothetical protein